MTTTIIDQDHDQTVHWFTQLALLDPRAGEAKPGQNSFFDECCQWLIRLADLYLGYDIEELRRHFLELSVEYVRDELFCDDTNVAVEFLLTRLMPQEYLSCGDGGLAHSVRELQFDAAIASDNQESFAQDGNSVIHVGPSDDAGLTTTVDCLPAAEVFAVPRGYSIVALGQYGRMYFGRTVDDAEPLPFRWLELDEEPIKKTTSTVNA